MDLRSDDAMGACIVEKRMTFPEFQHPGVFSPGCFGGSDEFSGMFDFVMKKPGCEPFVEKNSGMFYF